MKYHITHNTWYGYDEFVPVCHNLVHLAPRTTPNQRCLEYRLQVDPAPAFHTQRSDFFGNRAEYFSIEQPHRRLEISAASRVEVLPAKADRLQGSPPWEEFALKAMSAAGGGRPRSGVEPLLWQLACPSPRVPALGALRDFAERSFAPRRPLVEALAELTSRIHGEFKFDPRATTVDTPLAEVTRLRRGVCQDLAHLAVGCLRAMGLVARYTSGYLRTSAPPGKPRLVGADASHAWSSCYGGKLGWIDFDPTNNCFVSDAHVEVAWGRDYGDVCPIQGVFVGGGEHQIRVSVEVAAEGE